MNDFDFLRDAAIYVGTYHKYNCGSLFGKWMRLKDYADKAAFYKACRELHKDEEDPEFMFQDHEYIPDSLVGESWVSSKVWDLLSLDNDTRVKVGNFINATGSDIDDYKNMEDLVEAANDTFVGHFDSYDELGEAYLDGRLPKDLESFFDFDAYGRACANDMVSFNGDYFMC